MTRYRVVGYEGGDFTLAQLGADSVIWKNAVSGDKGRCPTFDDARSECEELAHRPIKWRPVRWGRSGGGIEVEIEFHRDRGRFLWKVYREGPWNGPPGLLGWVDIGGWARSLKAAKEAVETVIANLPPIFEAIDLPRRGRKRKEANDGIRIA